MKRGQNQTGRPRVVLTSLSSFFPLVFLESRSSGGFISAVGEKCFLITVFSKTSHLIRSVGFFSINRSIERGPLLWHLSFFNRFFFSDGDFCQGIVGTLRFYRLKNKAAVFYWFELNLETLLKFLLKHS